VTSLTPLEDSSSTRHLKRPNLHQATHCKLGTDRTLNESALVSFFNVDPVAAFGKQFEQEDRIDLGPRIRKSNQSPVDLTAP